MVNNIVLLLAAALTGSAVLATPMFSLRLKEGTNGMEARSDDIHTAVPKMPKGGQGGFDEIPEEYLEERALQA
uniref:Putative secreted protein n=1 Tax=Amblyomma parvum TaxID=251391 RepID=A0A023FSI0_AMBPA